MDIGMTRVFAFFGMGGLFLTISPSLRGTVTAGIGAVTQQMELYSPFSYIGGVVLVLLTLVFSFHRGAQAR
jgi:hypothetical protein